MLYFLFLCSGISGLIYQVIWVREFGVVFGNTVYSTSVVVAVFMLGLGAGAYLLGRWADHRYADAPDSLLRAYGVIEIVIAALGLVITLLLPRLGVLSAAVSSYQPDSTGWFVLSRTSYAARGVIAFVLLAPITLLMGGTLTLLIRHVVRRDVEWQAGSKIAALYAVNTAGAALGAFLTDFTLVPAIGLARTQVTAVLLNVVAGAGALFLAGRTASRTRAASPARSRLRRAAAAASQGRIRHSAAAADDPVAPARGATILTSIALALTGFAGLGLEIVWLRHFTLLLGGFRAVFSLLMTIVLAGIGLGAFAGGVVTRRTKQSVLALIAVEALFVIFTLLGMRLTSVDEVQASARAIDAAFAAMTAWQRWVAALRYNAWPMLIETGVPAVLMGCSFPIANAVIQHAEQTVGRRAGVLYFANTAGAVAGSLGTGYLLLPRLGIQHSVALLTAAAATALVPLAMAVPHDRSDRADRSSRSDRSRSGRSDRRNQKVPNEPTAPHAPNGSVASPRHRWAAATSLAAVAIAVGGWLQLPRGFIIDRSISVGPNEQVLSVVEGVNEILQVTEVPGRGRGLLTNGHAMSSTAPLDQRYMRALAHIPLLMSERPESVLVIGFGVGNTTHAATLHPSVRRVEAVDVSREVLEHADYFRDANAHVLANPKVSVYLNDGRQHLQMQPANRYDLITLEPPPIAHAGVGSLYSREFYALARSRLRSGGYLSQWLPAYQVPSDTTLAMVRAFIDVFPQSVLLSGAQAELLLVGTTASRIEIDPIRVVRRLAAAPEVERDLTHVDLGTLTEIVGSFVGSAATLERATAGVAPVTDDRPLQEYGVGSVLGAGLLGVPASLVQLAGVAQWCPRCFMSEEPIAEVAGLYTYLALLDRAYATPAASRTAGQRPAGERRTILGSAYLGAVVPESADIHYVLATAFLDEGRSEEALAELRRASELDPADQRIREDLRKLTNGAGR